ncbi:MAG: hypothetical protein J6C96_00965 [Oscillospiraceae bacterium]|nr:hypothetical protein [Oscillospiraceae bacterium]
MKLKKILSAAAAFALAAGVSAFSAFAVEDGQATYCFDKTGSMTEWQTYGSVEETGLETKIDSLVSKNGSGSLLVSENITSSVEKNFGGMYVDAETLGLPNFKGCTIEMSVLLCEGAEAYTDSFSLFSDGIIWLEAMPEALSTKDWTVVTLTLPENADNTRVGFTIPTYSEFTGDILYIDDFTVTSADGTVVANMGDYEAKKITEIKVASKGANIALTIAAVVLIAGIAGIIVLFVVKLVKRYR